MVRTRKRSMQFEHTKTTFPRTPERAMLEYQTLERENVSYVLLRVQVQGMKRMYFLDWSL